jgi:hypothetical protein
MEKSSEFAQATCSAMVVPVPSCYHFVFDSNLLDEGTVAAARRLLARAFLSQLMPSRACWYGSTYSDSHMKPLGRSNTLQASHVAVTGVVMKNILLK